MTATVLPGSFAFAQPAAGTGSPAATGTATPTGTAPAAEAPLTLDAARELFRQAGEDADAGHFQIALAKYRRVAAVKETAQVRFNIARCEEQLGQISTALTDYEQAQSEGKGDSGSDVSGLADERAAVLRPRIPHITLVPPSPEPPSFVVHLDGAVVPSGQLNAPIAVDPGRHRIEASAGGHEPFSKEVEISEKESIRSPLALEPAANASSGSSGSTQRTVGFVVGGVGAALGITSIVMTLVHNSKVSDVESECPDGRCSGAAYADATSAKSTASTEAGLAVGLGIAGLAGIGAGVALVLTAPKDAPTVGIRPGAVGAPGGMTLVGTF